MATTKQKPCPFCGASPTVEAVAYRQGETRYRIVCRACGAGVSTFSDTKAEALRIWDHRAHDSQCARCRFFEIGDRVDFCTRVHQVRKPSDFCSRWEEA